jgi:hypothetical protein
VLTKLDAKIPSRQYQTFVIISSISSKHELSHKVSEESSVARQVDMLMQFGEEESSELLGIYGILRVSSGIDSVIMLLTSNSSAASSREIGQRRHTLGVPHNATQIPGVSYVHDVHAEV